MANRTSHQLPGEPPSAVLKDVRRTLSKRDLQVVETVFAFRTTAQQVDNVITEWLEGTVGSPARFQILTLLWAARGSGVPHKEIVAALGVTRATVSGLMAALEGEGLVKSSASLDDRRNLLATLTSKGKAVTGKAIETNTSRCRAAFASFSSAELTAFTATLQRVREAFAGSANAKNRRYPENPRRSRHVR
jgi:DNA-binding MarR family transcriptional regulator